MSSKVVATVRKHRTPSEALIEDLKFILRIIKALGLVPYSQQNGGKHSWYAFDCYTVGNMSEVFVRGGKRPIMSQMVTEAIFSIGVRAIDSQIERSKWLRSYAQALI